MRPKSINSANKMYKTNIKICIFLNLVEFNVYKAISVSTYLKCNGENF